MPQRPLVWLITGCSSGFGLTLARAVQSHGHILIATSRNPSRTPDLVAEVETKGGKWLKMDVDDVNCAQIIEDLEASGNRVDVLVNNAGFSIHACVEQFTEEEVRRQMESLYFGPFRLIRAAVPHMRKQRFGIVVNMSSGAGLEGRESMGAYAPAKAALDGMSKVLAKEVAPFNVRVLIVSLGGFNTNMVNSITVGKNPMPEDYKGSVADQTIHYMASGKFDPDGDKEKAIKALYEVVMGEGVGAGHEGERFLPLGRDLAARVKQLQDQYAHSMEVFGDICNNVYRDR
ncbi:hypothetical protein M430DRAFT_70322 [Amorphotheca resinae ATCC 22711]|uniref:Short-chain oxidoreductase n=1 Tax=Amorphotheca resinae ATCC 22711 TaxID=857342 RepID=A0A2T3ANZ3_AMORE|nr:hypothetical protein M430DRAFT_70322 [Amorphotheca resinae ATCC 22711]PSS06647.1 hypothetical protein M430DRAFT_70322 [Amorphotheca resinae ATCC 22711]